MPAGKLACAARVSPTPICRLMSDADTCVACDFESSPASDLSKRTSAGSDDRLRGGERWRHCGATVLLQRPDLAVGGVFGPYASKHLIAFPPDLHGAVVDELAPAFTYRADDPTQM